MRRSISVIAVGVGLLASGESQASAQEPRFVGRVADVARTQVDGILVTARAANLPVEPLVDKALEAATKGAPPDRIVASVNRLLEELRVARQAFGENASAAELTAGAAAIRAGATKADLTRLKELRPRHPLTIAAGALADLVAAGVAADTGIAAVLALASNAGDADYIAFRRNVERDISQGASPASSIGVRLRAAGEMALAPRDMSSGSTSTTAPPRKRKP